jgi:hypothetical protein
MDETIKCGFFQMKERFGIMEQKMEEYANEKIVLEGGRQPTYPQVIDAI